MSPPAARPTRCWSRPPHRLVLRVAVGAATTGSTSRTEGFVLRVAVGAATTGSTSRTEGFVLRVAILAAATRSAPGSLALGHAERDQTLAGMGQQLGDLGDAVRRHGAQLQTAGHHTRGHGAIRHDRELAIATSTTQLARVATTQRGMPRRDPSRAPQGAYVVEPDRLLWYTKGEEISACTLDVLLVEHLDDAHPDWDLVPHRACDVATGLLVRGGALGDHGVLVRVAAVV